MSVYRFPRTRFVDENGLAGQLLHIESEVAEFRAEVFSNPDPFVVAIELADIIHSAETAMRILEEKHGICQKEVLAVVIFKNRERGYYETK